jgi:hypothetical protein
LSYLSPKFFIGSIKIGSIEGASCLNMGNNFPNGFTSHKKQNQGFGSITGDHNDIRGILSKLDDKDGVDMLNETDIENTPDWVKELIISQLTEEEEAETQESDEL